VEPPLHCGQAETNIHRQKEFAMNVVKLLNAATIALIVLAIYAAAHFIR